MNKSFRKMVRKVKKFTKGFQPKKFLSGIFASAMIVTLLIPTGINVAFASQVTDFSASIAPVISDVGASQEYVVTLTNSASSDKAIKSAKILIPSGFSITSSVVLGGTGSGWDLMTTATEIQMQKDGPNDLNEGQSITATFTATAPNTVGAYTWTAQAWVGNSFDNTQFSFSTSQPIVTVGDETPEPENPNTTPTITLIGANPIELTEGDVFADPGATASDEEDGDLTSEIVVTDNVNTAVAGSYTVTYTVEDSDSASAEVERTVNVSEAPNTLPTLSLIGANPIELTVGDAFTDPGATASDEEDGDITANITTAGTVDANTVGSYNIAYSVIDSDGGIASDNRTVNVNEAEVVVPPPTPNNIPTISLVGANPIELTVGDAFTDPGATASDEEDGDITANITTAGTVDANTVGSYNIAYSVIDSDGAIASTNRTVNVNAAPEEEVPSTPVENDAILCTDGLDNDGDTAFDLDDSDCDAFVVEEEPPVDEQPPVEEQPEEEAVPATEDTPALCADNLDNDGDGLIDLADPDPDCLQFYRGDGGGHSNGGGSGNGGGQVLGASTSNENSSVGEVLGASVCAPYISSYIGMGKKNNPNDVLKLQEFLNRELGLNLPLTGNFGMLTWEAVKIFQLKYSAEVLAPWVPFGLANDKTSTGYVYKTTQRWINKLNCVGGPEIALPQLP